jgi:hypothetical protein
MGSLRKVGFFRDLPHGNVEGPPLQESLQPSPGPFDREAAAYLRAGAVLAVATEEVFDVFDPGVNLGALTVRTDGIWVWPGELAHYVEKYHCALPDQFVDHMRARAWTPPSKDAIDFPSILKDVQESPVIDADEEPQ